MSAMIEKARAWMNDERHELFMGAVCLLILCGISYAFGRYSAPSKVVMTTAQTKTTHQVKETKTAKVDTHETKDDHAQVKTMVVYRDRIIHPDGTREEHEVEKSVTAAQDIHIDLTTSAVAAATSVVNDTTTTKTVTKEVERSQPAWGLGAMAGVRLQDGLQPVMGLEGDYRLGGPIKVMLWGTVNTAGTPHPTLGAGIHLDF